MSEPNRGSDGDPVWPDDPGPLWALTDHSPAAFRRRLTETGAPDQLAGLLLRADYHLVIARMLVAGVFDQLIEATRLFNEAVPRDGTDDWEAPWAEWGLEALVGRLIGLEESLADGDAAWGAVR